MNHLLELSRRARAHLAFAALAALVAVGCGGGGYGGGGAGTPPPTISISVAPTSIVLGQSATLTWSASMGSTCTASGGWSGTQAVSGTATETPTAVGTVTYTLACTGSGAYGGNTSGSATLTVTAPTSYSSTALVGDTAASGAVTVDANLVNPWGIAFSSSSFVWVANNHSETSTLYDGNGVPQPFATPLVVQLPNSATAVTFDPTGILFNGTGAFPVTNGTTSSTALFIFTGEGGMIGGWAPSVDATHAIAMYTDAGGAVYKGLALAKVGTANYLYATDFHNNKVDVFDTTFTKQASSATAFTFVDPTLPANYAPFGIQAINNGPGGATQLYVSYALQSLPDAHDNANGAGLGIVDIYDTNGGFVAHLVPTGGKLNAPWGMALAPADFGTLSNALLVGNFGDGTINAYDPASGAYVGTVADSTGAAFAAPGLWGIAFGNDAHNQPHNTLFYAAGLNDEANGVYGRLDVGAAPVLGAPPVVTLTAPSGTVNATVAVTATATDALGISKVEFFLNGTTSLGVVTTAPYSVQWDTTTVADGAVQLTAKATDPDGHVATSAAVTVTVSNTVAATTLTQIQTTVFGPICSGCHSGVGNVLPGSQNLTSAAASYAALVNVASSEQPTILKVKPNDPDHSYLIMKLEGAAGISGSQMPLGGPPLSQATIDQIKSWISAGAPNN